MSNNDNAMTRFLFAILQQKSLKDIDWQKVADDPILTQKITNGHAARMRYSRFRAAMLGLEPQRRNRQNPESSKARVCKRKRDDKNGKKKLDAEDEEETVGAQIKRDPATIASASASHSQLSNSDMPSPRVKEERGHGASQSRSLSHSQTQPSNLGLYQQAPAANMSTLQPRMTARFLTPSSDCDFPLHPIPATREFTTHSPSPDPSEMLQSDPTLDFPEDSYVNYDDESRWHQNSPTAFNPNFIAGGGDTHMYQSPLCEQHRPQSASLVGLVDVGHAHHYLRHAGLLPPSPEDTGISPSGLMLSQGSNVLVKEEWDTRRY